MDQDDPFQAGSPQSGSQHVDGDGLNDLIVGAEAWYKQQEKQA